MPLLYTSAQTIAFKLTTTMRSPLALSAFIIGCVVILFPNAALGVTVPAYNYKAPPPTGSPTSVPSYQPTLQPESYLRTAYGEPTSGFWLITSLAAGALLAGVVSLLVWKKRDTLPPEDEGEGGFLDWISSFWRDPSWDDSIGDESSGDESIE